MALIKCPECGKSDISDSLEACPDCGYPIRKRTPQELFDKKTISCPECGENGIEKSSSSCPKCGFPLNLLDRQDNSLENQITCPECGKTDISDSVDVCPDCGYPIRKRAPQELSDKKTISCPECGENGIEQSSPSCPKCGFPLHKPNPDIKHINSKGKTINSNAISIIITGLCIAGIVYDVIRMINIGLYLWHRVGYFEYILNIVVLLGIIYISLFNTPYNKKIFYALFTSLTLWEVISLFMYERTTHHIIVSIITVIGYIGIICADKIHNNSVSIFSSLIVLISKLSYMHIIRRYVVSLAALDAQAGITRDYKIPIGAYKMTALVLSFSLPALYILIAGLQQQITKKNDPN